MMPTWRALIAAAVPGLITFLVFWRLLGTAAPVAALVGLIWAVASLFVTRLLYDENDAEAAAWREQAPDLAASPSISDLHPADPLGVPDSRDEARPA
jgi:Mg/Co/Ni transporter MgtE